LDHLIRAQQQRLRECEAERLGRLEIDDQLELRGLLDRRARTIAGARLAATGSSIAAK
jgi:hypothetical protein